MVQTLWTSEVSRECPARLLSAPPELSTWTIASPTWEESMEVPETCLDEGEDARPRKIPKQAIRKVSKNSADELSLLRAPSPGRLLHKRPEVPRKVLGKAGRGLKVHEVKIMEDNLLKISRDLEVARAKAREVEEALHIDL
ncbi:hypothetical protein B296_00052558 [Ensete ventricosum]|uniref:Uncharacterized protein n=1 Tax=Ensete ventricosum TaxID=4639 RepID=A0A426Y608_ENSVE|nr:hypothetical protein B296_00052558 [Ensete ventricosum]